MSTRDEKLLHRQPAVVPEYAQRDPTQARISRLAIAVFVVSVAASPLLLRLTPHPIVRAAWRITGMGFFVWTLPVVASLAFTVCVATRYYRRFSRGSFVFVKLALIINLFSLAAYVFIALSWQFVRLD